MKHYFNVQTRHRVTEANINYYATPFIHPERKMGEHDFIYMLDGKWKLGQNDEIYDLKKDSLLILGAGLTHKGLASCAAGTKTMYFHVSRNDGDLISPTLEGEDLLNSLTDASVNRNIRKIFHEIVSAKLSDNDRKADLLFDLMLCELFDLQDKGDGDQLGEKIKTIIHRSPEKFYSNKALADMLGVSVKTAENKFKAQFGVTIHRYILSFKVEQAISYLKNFPEMQIKEIAYNLGFYDEYHFSKQFKNLTGLSPTEYRKKV